MASFKTMKNEFKNFPNGNCKDFDNHPFIIKFGDSNTGLRGFIAIHKKNNSFPSFGATRLWCYESESEALKDALRLSKMMSYKAAMAGIKAGGAKAVIIQPEDGKFNRKKLFEAYAAKINLVGGNFITGTDVGLLQKDLDTIKKITPFVVGFNNNANEFTALGVYESIKTSLKHLFGGDSIKGRGLAIQGLGKTGSGLLDLLYKDTKEIFVADINKEVVKKIKNKYPEIKVVSTRDICKQKVDIFVPCALGGAINSKTLPYFKCKIIVGSANNQLENEEMGALLHKLGILYAPDYVVNAGGLIAVVDEYENKKYSREIVMNKVMNIKKTLKSIFSESAKQDKPTNIVANEMAENIFNKYNGRVR
ncbi:MAG: Glu/Leu/Phe/Val dehydrogenase dimerization domain-containing protein [Patescibacteria group bacterium]